MLKISELADQIAINENIATPRLVKVDVQVRTCGGILPPSWIRAEKHDPGAEGNKMSRPSHKLLGGVS